MSAFTRLAAIAADPAPCLTARQIIEARAILKETTND